MSDPRIDGAIEALVEKINAQLSEVAETKRVVNRLCAAVNRDPIFTDADDAPVLHGAAIRPDQYYGRPLATAAQDFLNRRKSAASADEILKGLQSGGFDFKALGWKESDWLRSLSMSLAKNTQTFHRLPTGHYGLLSWYPDIRKKPPKDEKAAKPNGGANGQAAPEEPVDTMGDTDTEDPK